MSWSHGGGKWLGLRGLVRASETKWKPWLTQRERERERERETEMVLECPSRWIYVCVCERERERERVRLRSFSSTRQEMMTGRES